MSYQEVTEEGWFSRIKSAIIGIFFGIILFFLGFPLLFWNEGRAVHRAQSLTEGKGAVVSVNSGSVQPENDGKLIHTSGLATTEETLKDGAFGVSAEHSILLDRKVEMFQWKEKQEKETKKQLGGKKKTVTTYSYEQVWSEQLLDSSGYKEAGHTNPSQLPFESHEEMAEKVTLGAFQLPPELVKLVGPAKSVPINDKTLAQVSPDVRKKLSVANGGYFFGANAGSPQIGDTRITFETVPPSEVSVIGVQTGKSLSPYTAKSGGSTIFELVQGDKTAADMFTSLEESNQMMTWILRLVGFLMLAIGISLVLSPMAVIADIIPFVGDIVGAGVGFIAFALAIPFTLITIAVGWIAYRPLLGIALLLVAGAIIFLVAKKVRAK